MTLEQIKNMSAAEVAEHLTEYQKYRRGEPPYAYGSDNHPFTPRELGDIINRSIELLKKITMDKIIEERYLIFGYDDDMERWACATFANTYGEAVKKMDSFKDSDKSFNRNLKYQIVKETTNQKVVYDEL